MGLGGSLLRQPSGFRALLTGFLTTARFCSTWCKCLFSTPALLYLLGLGLVHFPPGGVGVWIAATDFPSPLGDFCPCVLLAAFTATVPGDTSPGFSAMGETADDPVALAEDKGERASARAQLLLHDGYITVRNINYATSAALTWVWCRYASCGDDITGWRIAANFVLCTFTYGERFPHFYLSILLTCLFKPEMQAVLINNNRTSNNFMIKFSKFFCVNLTPAQAGQNKLWWFQTPY